MKSFLVTHVNDSEQSGIAIDQTVQALPTEDGKVVFKAIIAVLWENQRSPAPSYHTPEELLWVDCPEITTLLEDEDGDPDAQAIEDETDVTDEQQDS